MLKVKQGLKEKNNKNNETSQIGGGKKGRMFRTPAAHSEDGSNVCQALLSIHHCIIQPEVRQTSDLTPTAHFSHLILTELSCCAEFCTSGINFILQLLKCRVTNLPICMMVQLSEHYFCYHCCPAEKEQQSLTQSPVSKSTM